MDDYDERKEELVSIAAIFPELVIDAENDYAASLELPVITTAPLLIQFAGDNDKRELTHLPSLHVRVTLPSEYPETAPPTVSLATASDWLPEAKLQQLEQEAEKLWEEYGHCQILFSYFDLLQQAAERGFDYTDGLALDIALMHTLVESDARVKAKTKQDAFDRQWFTCEMCDKRKKGTECHQYRYCEHVCCRACLHDAYTGYINENDFANVCCLYHCRDDEKKHRLLSPAELLDMGMPEPLVRRLVDMKRKKAVEADKNTVYCPRSWCQAPARSQKYPPMPDDLRDYPSDVDDDDDDDDDEDDNNNSRAVVPLTVANPPSNKKHFSRGDDRLSICSNRKCSLAFCRICKNTWHGEYTICLPRAPAELTDDERATYNFLLENTTPCPDCDAYVEKNKGCNHITCINCHAHFCYICRAWLEPGNPYSHYNHRGTPCFERLYDAEDMARGAQYWEQEARRVAAEADAREEAERLQNIDLAQAAHNDMVNAHDQPPPHEQRQENFEDHVARPDPAAAERHGDAQNEPEADMRLAELGPALDQIAHAAQEQIHHVLPEAPEPPEQPDDDDEFGAWELLANDRALQQQWRVFHMRYPADEANDRMHFMLQDVAQERRLGLPPQPRDHDGHVFQRRQVGRTRRGHLPHAGGRHRGAGPHVRLDVP